MFRSQRRPLTVGLFTAVTVLLAATPVVGQSETELALLEVRRSELSVELGDIQTELVEAEAGLDQLDAENEAAQIQIELIADEFERAAHARREPAQTRVQIALAGFTAGDPRQTALIDEILALQGTSDKTRATRLYTAVIEDAQNRLVEAENRLRDVADQMAGAKTALGDAQARAKAAQESYNEIGQVQLALTVELEETVTRIEVLRALQQKALLTGVTVFEEVFRPALAVKIDNVSAARPQAGLNDADIVYVEEVEGKVTRLAAVFHSTIPTEVGPVRSMRTGDFDLLGQFNSPLFANSGGNRITTQLLQESTLVNIGHARNGSLYYRTSRSAPHNLFTNPANLWSVGSGEEYDTGLPQPIFRFRTADAVIRGDVSKASGVTIDYGNTSVEYRWNSSGWARSQDGKPMLDTGGTQVVPTTVVIQFTKYVTSRADSRSPEAVTVGRGDAWILTDGQVSKGFWRRQEATEPIEYVDSSGNFIEILPGRTWVEMPRDGGAELR